MRASETERPNPIVFLGEEIFTAFSAVASVLLARFAVIDSGRGDIPNTILETVGTFIAVALAARVGKDVLSKTSRKADPPKLN
jgi:uncharacterized YccA/Bax inhibitor family protein